jgi:methionyl-tRNA formyltransferase
VPTPQAGDATYCPKIRAEDAVVDWTRPASELALRVRAFQPWPGAVTRLERGTRLKIVRARAVPGAADAGPGTVVAAARRELLVACGQGRLAVIEAQPEGKRVMSSADLVNGRLVRAGERLGG